MYNVDYRIHHFLFRRRHQFLFRRRDHWVENRRTHQCCLHSPLSPSSARWEYYLNFRDENGNFVLLIWCFETRTGTSFFQARASRQKLKKIYSILGFGTKIKIKTFWVGCFLLGSWMLFIVGIVIKYTHQNEDNKFIANSSHSTKSNPYYTPTMKCTSCINQTMILERESVRNLLLSEKNVHLLPRSCQSVPYYHCIWNETNERQTSLCFLSKVIFQEEEWEVVAETAPLVISDYMQFGPLWVTSYCKYFLKRY